MKKQKRFEMLPFSEKKTEELEKPRYWNSEKDPTDIIDVMELARRRIPQYGILTRIDYLNAVEEIQRKMQGDGFIDYEDVEIIIEKHKLVLLQDERDIRTTMKKYSRYQKEVEGIIKRWDRCKKRKRDNLLFYKNKFYSKVLSNHTTREEG